MQAWTAACGGVCVRVCVCVYPVCCIMLHTRLWRVGLLSSHGVCICIHILSSSLTHAHAPTHTHTRTRTRTHADMHLHIHMYSNSWDEHTHTHAHTHAHIQICICIFICTANPTWGDIFECCFKAQSSKLQRLFCHVSVKRDVRALSCEL